MHFLRNNVNLLLSDNSVKHNGTTGERASFGANETMKDTLHEIIGKVLSQSENFKIHITSEKQVST